MKLLIDGYNLLHASSVFPRSRSGATLRQSREALLDFLADLLEPEEAPQTTVVFDAREAPPGLPSLLHYRELTVRFAPRQSCADEMIEELIRADSAPRQLTVVSSDHRVQVAAKRRRARAIDSDRWLAQRLRAREELPPDKAAPDEKPPPPLPHDSPFPPGYGEDVDP